MERDILPMWPHQEKAVARAVGRSEYAFLFDVGTGKSRALLETLRGVINSERRMMRVLIVCPVICVRNWRDEILKFTKVDPKSIVMLEGSEKDRIKRLSLTCFSVEPNEKILITNYEGLLMKGLFDQLTKWCPEVLVADEMHRLKDATTKRSRAMQRLGARAKYRYGLTGTAVLNSYLDVYGQWLYLDGGASFGRNFMVFRNEHFYDKNAAMPKHVHFPCWVARPDAAERIKAKMQEKASTADRDDVLKLPPLIKQVVKVPLSKEQRKHYESLKKDLITYIHSHVADTKTVVAQTALVLSLRLMQATSGFLKDDTGTITELKTNTKLDALEELLDLILPHKVIIWCSFINNYSQIAKLCAKKKVNYVECHGGIPNHRKFQAVEQFNTNPETKVFIGHPASLGIGINLVAARYMVYFSRDYSLGNDIQSEARNYRAGSEIHETIVRYDLVSEDTIDEQCLSALQDKKEISFSVLKNWILP